MKKLFLISLFVSGYCHAGYPVPDCNNPSLTNELSKLIITDLKPANKNEPVFFIDTAKSIKKDPDNYLNICETKVSTSYPNEESITVPVQYAVYQDGENTVTVEYDRDAFWREFDKAQKNMPDAAEILAANPGYFYKIPKNAPPSTYAYSVNQSQSTITTQESNSKKLNLALFKYLSGKAYKKSDAFPAPVITIENGVASVHGEYADLDEKGNGPMSTCNMDLKYTSNNKYVIHELDPSSNAYCDASIELINGVATFKSNQACQSYCGIHLGITQLNGFYK